MEPVLYIPAGTRQLELIMYISSFSYSCGSVWTETLFSECCSLSRSCTLFLKKTGNLRHSSPKWGSSAHFKLDWFLTSPCNSLKALPMEDDDAGQVMLGAITTGPPDEEELPLSQLEEPGYANTICTLMGTLDESRTNYWNFKTFCKLEICGFTQSCFQPDIYLVL